MPLSETETAAGEGFGGVGLTQVTAPCRVIAFCDDLMCPPHLCAEFAEAIPECDYVEIASCGHLGYLERPDEVNSAIIEFLDKN